MIVQVRVCHYGFMMDAIWFYEGGGKGLKFLRIQMGAN